MIVRRTVKFGRLPVRHTLQTRRSLGLMRLRLAALGPAPAVSSDWVKAVDAVTGGDWGMLGNDRAGDCVEACEGHYLMLRTANTGKIVIPTIGDILGLYSAETGYNGSPSTDNGTDESSDAQFMVSTGLLGHKAMATGMVDHTNIDHVKWCVELFGAIELGINVPEFAMEQFNAGQPWDADPNGDQTLAGGHSVPIVKYDGTYFYVVTWGKLQPMTPAFYTALIGGGRPIVEEAHATLYPDWIAPSGLSPPGFSLPRLAAELGGEVEAIAISFSEPLALSIAFLDQYGELMTVEPDHPPAWSLSAPTVQQIAAAADGLTAVTSNIGVGPDTIGVTLTAGGKQFSASLPMEVA